MIHLKYKSWDFSLFPEVFLAHDLTWTDQGTWKFSLQCPLYSFAVAKYAVVLENGHFLLNQYRSDYAVSLPCWDFIVRVAFS